ncbi:MAG: chemotaxis protein CheW [Deltaproteobacteria bacterium]|nr:chemotaxis protein CheW [Deltaproteobacteria bacterium]
MKIEGRQPDLPETKEQNEVDMHQFLVVKLASGLYAFAAQNVVHVALPLTPMPVPTAPTFILGIIHIQGRFIAAVDFQQWLQVSSPVSQDTPDINSIHNNNNARLVVIEGTQSAIAILVDSVVGLQSIAANAIHTTVGDVADNHNGTLIGRVGIFDSSNGPTTILNTNEIIASLINQQQTSNNS